MIVQIYQGEEEEGLDVWQQLPEIKSEFYEIIPMTEIRNDGTGGADEECFLLIGSTWVIVLRDTTYVR